MKILLIFGVVVLTSVFAEEQQRLDNLQPNEAQQILDQQDLSLKYAPKVDTNVPAVRYLGNEPHDVLEDIYLARQFHGQDGIGGYVYGYAVPDIAKAEKKKAGGDLTGSYSYINGAGQEIKVEYWDDGTGFHQTDNLPKPELIANEDTEEVKAAKEEHFRIWNEIAQQHKSYNPNAPVEPDNSYNPADDEKYNDDSSRWEEKPYVKRPEEEEPEPPKDPRGFFYSFDYPVGIIVSDKGRSAGAGPQHQKREADALNDLYNKNRAILNADHKVAKRAVPIIYLRSPAYAPRYPAYFHP